MSISLYTISAICGNFHKESTVNPGIYESLNVVPLTDNSVYGGYGLGQWTNKPSAGLTRRTQLVEYLRQYGYADDSGEGQLMFLLAENYWHQNVGSYSSLTDFLNNTSTDINELTRIYMRNWEGINNGTLSERQQWANKFYNYINEHFNDTSINTWYASNSYLSESQQCNNAVLVARFLWDSPDPPEPTPPIPPEPIPDTDFLELVLMSAKYRKKKNKRRLKGVDI